MQSCLQCDSVSFLINVIDLILVRELCKGAPKGGGGFQIAALPMPPKLKFKKNRFCRYSVIKKFLWIPLQPKTATEIN
jgi:hypothetical protein